MLADNGANLGASGNAALAGISTKDSKGPWLRQQPTTCIRSDDAQRI